MVASGRNVKDKKHKSVLVGVGLDNDDGHTRITRGDNFGLFGGSADTHEQMREKAIKLNEKLSEKGVCLDDVTRDEFLDTAHEVGMTVVPDDVLKKDK